MSLTLKQMTLEQIQTIHNAILKLDPNTLKAAQTPTPVLGVISEELKKLDISQAEIDEVKLSYMFARVLVEKIYTGEIPIDKARVATAKLFEVNINGQTLNDEQKKAIFEAAEDMMLKNGLAKLRQLKADEKKEIGNIGGLFILKSLLALSIMITGIVVSAKIKSNTARIIGALVAAFAALAEIKLMYNVNKSFNEEVKPITNKILLEKAALPYQAISTIFGLAAFHYEKCQQNIAAIATLRDEIKNGNGIKVPVLDKDIESHLLSAEQLKAELKTSVATKQDITPIIERIGRVFPHETVSKQINDTLQQMLSGKPEDKKADDKAKAQFSQYEDLVKLYRTLAENLSNLAKEQKKQQSAAPELA